MLRLDSELFLLLTAFTSVCGQIGPSHYDVDDPESRMFGATETEWTNVRHTARITVEQKTIGLVREIRRCTGSFVAPLLMISAHWCFEDWQGDGVFMSTLAKIEVSVNRLQKEDEKQTPAFFYKVDKLLYTSEDSEMILLGLDYPPADPNPSEAFSMPGFYDYAASFELPMENDLNGFIGFDCTVKFVGAATKFYHMTTIGEKITADSWTTPNIYHLAKIKLANECPVPDFKADNHVCSLNTKFTVQGEYHTQHQMTH